MSFTDIKGYDRKQHLNTKLYYGNDQNFIAFVECLDDSCPSAFELQFTDGVAGITICYKKRQLLTIHRSVNDKEVHCVDKDAGNSRVITKIGIKRAVSKYLEVAKQKADALDQKLRQQAEQKKMDNDVFDLCLKKVNPDPRDEKYALDAWNDSYDGYGPLYPAIESYMRKLRAQLKRITNDYTYLKRAVAFYQQAHVYADTHKLGSPSEYNSNAYWFYNYDKRLRNIIISAGKRVFLSEDNL